MFFFFNETATTEIYTLSLHERSSDLPARRGDGGGDGLQSRDIAGALAHLDDEHGLHPVRPDAGRSAQDRKSTRLNSSHANISYAAFCLKKKHYQIIRIRSINVAPDSD